MKVLILALVLFLAASVAQAAVHTTAARRPRTLGYDTLAPSYAGHGCDRLLAMGAEIY
jgi:hypothetical protein